MTPTPGNKQNSSYSPYYATGATQTSGGYSTYNNGLRGSFGIGSAGENYVYGYGSTGGGGGYYGGGGSISYDWNDGGSRYRPGAGTGGSSFISGHTGCVAVTSSTDTNPKSGCTTGTTDNNCSVHYSGLKFNNTIMIDGNGYKWTNTKGGQEQMPNPNGGYYNLGAGHNSNGQAKITLIDE